MKNKIYLFCLIGMAAHSASAATITVTGPTAVCPSTQYTYTASAKNIVGPQKGCFAWTFSVNGTIVGVAGGITCPCASQSSSYTTNFTWPATQGNFSIHVNFTPFNFPCPTYSSGTLTGQVRVVVPEVIFDTNGGLSFCSPGQTRTVSVPNVPYNSSNYCNWHHAYDWIVPAGWTILPTPPFTPQDFTTIAGGIRTHHTSVNITAPSTPLAPGFTGNYFITVRTEPAWSWPKQITRQIWVGTYGTSLTISGTAGVCPGNNYTYTVTPPGGQQQNGHVYAWTRPANWTTQFQGPNYIQYYVPQSPNYGPVQVSINNGCGVNTNGITAYPGFNCGGFMMSIYPNPAQEELTVEMIRSDEALSPQDAPKFNEVRLMNSEGETVRESDESESQIKLNLRGLKKGQYYLHVRVGDQVAKEQVVIN